MTALEWELVVGGLGRLEAPCFDVDGRLCFVDRTPPGRLLRLEDDGSLTTLAERSHVGGLVAHAGGGLVASGHTVSVINQDGSERVLLEPGTGWGFNDLGTSADGKVYVGRFDVDPMPPASGQGGSMWRIGPDGASDHCYDGIQLTNGVGVSPDGTQLYHNDTTPRVVWVSDLSGDGLPANRRVLYRFEEGSPDGMAVDEAGCVLVVLIGSGKIARITPEGKEDQALNGPVDWTASVCFGSKDPHELYAVTFGGAPYDPDHDGGVYRTRVDVAGAPIHPATV